jgi:hypothetical protein
LAFFSFSSSEEAIAGIEEVNSRYRFHCAKAREIAAAHFDYRKILPALIEAAMACK